MIRPWAYWFFHSWRLFGYTLIVPPLMFLRPKKTLIGSIVSFVAYCAVHRKRWWQEIIHRFCGYGASGKHQIVNDYSRLIHPDKRYLWSLHPHGVLADGWHSIIARNPSSFTEEGNGPPGIGRKIALCFAPVIKHVPIHQEMYRDKCSGSDKKSIIKWWRETSDTDPALLPGGFAESVFANAADRQYEYSYIKDRKGFIRICLEEGKDIVPVYTFRATRMYFNPAVLRGMRARLSQTIYIGLVVWIGWLGTSMPLTDETTTVVFPPFEVSKFKAAEVDQAHAAYMEHLKTNFDTHKARYGMEGVELVFVGSDFRDEDCVARALRRVGIISDQVKPRRRSLQQAEPVAV